MPSWRSCAVVVTGRDRTPAGRGGYGGGMPSLAERLRQVLGRVLGGAGGGAGGPSGGADRARSGDHTSAAPRRHGNADGGVPAPTGHRAYPGDSTARRPSRMRPSRTVSPTPARWSGRGCPSRRTTPSARTGRCCWSGSDGDWLLGGHADEQGPRPRRRPGAPGRTGVGRHRLRRLGPRAAARARSASTGSSASTPRASGARAPSSAPSASTTSRDAIRRLRLARRPGMPTGPPPREVTGPWHPGAPGSRLRTSASERGGLLRHGRLLVGGLVLRG